MTPDQIELAQSLGGVTFVPATGTKRFAKQMMSLAEHSPEKELTEKQAIYLYGVVHRFRRQIPRRIVEKAERLLAEAKSSRDSGMISDDTPTFAQLVERAGGPQALAAKLKVGKDWVYRRLSGETPIKEKDELLIAQAMDAARPAKRRARKSGS